MFVFIKMLKVVSKNTHYGKCGKLIVN